MTKDHLKPTTRPELVRKNMARKEAEGLTSPEISTTTAGKENHDERPSETVAKQRDEESGDGGA